MKQTKIYLLRVAIIVIVLSNLFYSTACCPKKEISFIPIAGENYRSELCTIPLEPDKKDALLSFITEKGENISASKSKKEKLKNKIKPFSPEDYKALLEELSKAIIIEDIRIITEKRKLHKVRGKFRKWFKEPFVYDFVDSRAYESYEVEEKNDCTLTFALSDGFFWWIFSYKGGAIHKIVKVLVVKLPE